MLRSTRWQTGGWRDADMHDLLNLRRNRNKIDQRAPTYDKEYFDPTLFAVSHTEIQNNNSCTQLSSDKRTTMVLLYYYGR